MQKRNGEGLYCSQIFLEAFLDFSSPQHCTHGNLEGQKKTKSGQRVREVGNISKAGDHKKTDGCGVGRGTQAGLQWGRGRHSWEEKDNQARKGLGADSRARRTELISWGSGSQRSF